jgi:hypothetical protein
VATNDSTAPVHDGRHPQTVEEWVFAAWTVDAQLGVISGHRIVGSTAWYWAALARSGRPLLHITDYEVPVRADPFILKGEAMWAEHFCDDPMKQWSIGNETYAAALDDPDDALGRAYGIPTPIAFDLEWYATGEPAGLVVDGGAGYEQRGVVHGALDIFGEPRNELEEVLAHRWHRWTEPARDANGGMASGEPTSASLGMGPIPVDAAVAHSGVRAPFKFPNGASIDLVLTPSGWRRRPW